MIQPIIEVKNLSKEYIISHNTQPYYTLRDSLIGFVKKPFEFLFAKNSSSKKEKFLALNDINFSVMPGEVIGIIGRNGAGKSTLLKILSQITPPTSGSIHLRGRVASLLEVGTGFHPELTGRENIFLNGAILGMTQKEIKSKFNEIVEFAGIEKFLDTPVKRYSSGMYVRLAFSVAAHLEPEILIVDEVLAVGDAEFQKKCLGKMDEIAKKNGRTVLFVSHNMAAVQSLCSKAFLVEKGKLLLSGNPYDVINKYLEKNSGLISRNLSAIKDRGEGGVYFRFSNFDILDLDRNSLTHIQCGSKVNFEINFQVLSNEINNLRIGITIKDWRTGVVITDLNSYYGSEDILSCKKGNHSYVFMVNHFPLSPGRYSIGFIATSGLDVVDWIKDGGQMVVSEGLFYASGKMPIDKNSQIFFTEYNCKLIN